MTVLVLSPYPEKIAAAIEACGDATVTTSERITEVDPSWSAIVSFGYRHILKERVLSRFPRSAFNLHISVLPWNRGAHPNFWSWVDRTPKGVTLHLMDMGIDTGPIVAQEIVPLDPMRNLEETYFDLREAAEALFARNWKFLRTGRFEVFEQAGAGSVHKAKELHPDTLAVAKINPSKDAGHSIVIAGDPFGP